MHRFTFSLLGQNFKLVLFFSLVCGGLWGQKPSSSAGNSELYYDDSFQKEKVDLSKIGANVELLHDVFGNAYLPEELSISKSDQPETKDAPMFNLIFEDEIVNNGIGFDLEQNRKVARSVFSNLSERLSAFDNTCTEGQPPVNIVFRESEEFNGLNNYLGYSSPVFLGSSYGGLNSGLPWHVINTGQDPFEGDIEHGIIEINFAQYGESFSASVPGTITPIGSDKIALYSVIYHHALRCLGVITDLGIAGTQQNPEVRSRRMGTIWLAATHYDAGLTLYDGSPLIEGGSLNQSNPGQHNSTTGAEELLSNCAIPMGTPVQNIRFSLSNGDQIPVFSTAEYVEEISFQSFIDFCGGPVEDYLMFPIPVYGRLIEISSVEEQMLCDIGYSLPALENCNCQMAAAIDFGPNCGEGVYEAPFCPVSTNQNFITIDPADLLANDNGIEEITWLGTTCSGPGCDLGNGSVSFNNSTGLYQFTPDRIGRHVLIYFSNSACGRTNNGIVYINGVLTEECEEETDQICADFEETMGCPAEGSPFTDLPVCNSSESCADAGCNLVCNSSICATVYTEHPLREDRFERVGFPIGTPLNDAIFQFTNFYYTHGSPAYFHGLSQDSNGGSMSIGGGTTNGAPSSNGIFTPVAIEDNQRYFLSVFSSGTSVFGNGEFSTQPYQISLIDHTQITTGLTSGSGEVDNTGDEEKVLTPFQQQTGFEVNWERFGTTFSFNEANCINCNAIWIKGLKIGEDGATDKSKFVIDNLELIPDDFSAGQDRSINCGEETALGSSFCMLENVTVAYDWFEVDPVTGQTINGPIFSYTEINGTASPSSLFTVSPEESTTYRLVRTLVQNANVPNGFTLCDPMNDITDCSFSFDDVTVVVNGNCGTGPGCPTCDQSISYNITAGVGTNITDTALPSGQTNNACIYLEGKLIIGTDNFNALNYSFTNCHFYMAPGAGIQVDSGSELLLNNNTFEACSEMWRGIRLFNKGNIEAVNNTFRDAEYAIQFSANNEAIIQDNIFEDNHVGIYKSTSTNDFAIQLRAPITGNTFRFNSPGTLAPPYPSQATENSTGVPYAGILLFNAQNLSFGDENNENVLSNTFSLLNNGIVAHNTDIACFQCEFDNIEPTGSDDINAHTTGDAIYVNSGRVEVDDSEFTKLNNGIRSINGSISVTNSDFEIVNTGITAKGMADEVTVDDNKFRFIETGVFMDAPSEALPFSISDNLLITGGQNSNAVGIRLKDGTPGSNNDFAMVDNNTLRIHDRADGIILLRWHFTQLQDNKIRFTISSSLPAPWPATGIILTGTRDVRSNGSEIWATQPSSQHIYGQHVQSGIRTSVCCSSTKDILVGFYFSKNNWATSFRHNEMENNYHMLHLRDGFIQAQDYAGNKFIGQPMVVNDYDSWPANMQSYIGPDPAHAIYKAAGNGWQSSRFELAEEDCDEDTWPTIVIPAQSCPGNGSEWFYANVPFGPIYACGTDSDCPGSVGGEGNGGGVISPGKSNTSGGTEINEPLSPVDFSIAPNPANERLTISYHTINQTGSILINLMDVNGRVIKATTLPDGVEKYTFDVSELPPGLYLLRSTDSTGNNQLRKVIIQ